MLFNNFIFNVGAKLTKKSLINLVSHDSYALEGTILVYERHAVNLVNCFVLVSNDMQPVKKSRVCIDQCKHDNVAMYWNIL